MACRESEVLRKLEAKKLGPREATEYTNKLRKMGVDIPKEARQIFADHKAGRISEKELDRRFLKLDGGR